MLRSRNVTPSIEQDVMLPTFGVFTDRLRAQSMITLWKRVQIQYFNGTCNLDQNVICICCISCNFWCTCTLIFGKFGGMETYLHINLWGAQAFTGTCCDHKTLGFFHTVLYNEVATIARIALVQIRNWLFWKKVHQMCRVGEWQFYILE